MTDAHIVKRSFLVRIVSVVHWSAYYIWVGLLAARVALLVALLFILLVNVLISRAHAAPRDIRVERQATIAHVLTQDSPETVARIRGGCATGRQPASITQRRAAGLVELPDAADYCVAALTRIGRNGKIGYVRDPSAHGVTPALAFDSGFVDGYRKREAVPAGLPSMAALKPVAQRCLAQAEPDIDLCASAGYAYGMRAANGENVRAS